MGIGCGSLHVHVPLVETLIWHIGAILGFLRMMCMCPKPKFLACLQSLHTAMSGAGRVI